MSRFFPRARFASPGARLAGACMVLLGFAACATDADVNPRNAHFDFRISPATETGRFVTRIDTDSLVWRIDTALACLGEIGIHWGRRLGKTAHDVPGGKPSPKIYEYFAVDLRAGRTLQTLTVDPAVYDHIHMILRPGDDVTRGIDSLPAAWGRSLYVTGTVEHDDTIRPFRVEIDSTYRENDLGDVTFTLEAHEDRRYRLNLSARVVSWFSGILPRDLHTVSGDTVLIRLDNANRAAALNLETRYALDNAFELTVDVLDP